MPQPDWSLPTLPTMGVGSYAAPGWFVAGNKQFRAGAFGPHDMAEMLDDATRVVVADQIEAGVDILSDGELSRQRFVYEMYDRLSGLKRLPPVRRLGVPGYDMAPRFVAEDEITAPNGLGLVEEYRRLLPLAGGRPVKLAFPGALTFALAIQSGEQHGETVLAQLVSLVRAEIEALVEAGAAYIQLDEPSLPAPSFGLSIDAAAEVINETLTGHDARMAVHVCFGNNAGRPMADRRLSRLLHSLNRLQCDQLVLEFANQEMVDAALLAELDPRFAIAAGVVDVKSFHVETPDDVARRLDRVLEFVPPDRLTATADCGFSALPRYLARLKLDALVAGTRLVRGRLA